jgi:hypothetical protein
MRASATAPSLATSNASRKDLASLQNSRAAALLTRVAGYSSAQMQGYEHGGVHRRTGSVCSSAGESPSGSPSSSSHGERKEPFEIVISQCKFLSCLHAHAPCYINTDTMKVATILASPALRTFKIIMRALRGTATTRMVFREGQKNA